MKLKEGRFQKTFQTNNRVDYNSKTILNNFDKWFEVLKRNYPDLQTSKSGYFAHTDTVKLGQSRLALTAYGNALSEIHRKSMKTDVDSYICLRSVHEKLLIALRLCYIFGLEPRNTARKLIQEILFCNGNLHSIFSVLSFCHVTREFPGCDTDSFTLYPGINGEVFNEILPAFEYYLSSLVPPKFGNTLAQFKLPDILNKPIYNDSILTPLMAASMWKDPLLVQLLLRYGANPLFKITGDDQIEEQMQSPMDYIIRYLNGFCSLSKYNKFNGNVFQQASECLYLMTSSVANVQIKVSCMKWNPDQHTKKTSEPKTFYLHPNLVKFISLKEFSCPSSLQQQCRVTIRQHIFHHNNGSPLDIVNLPVPQILRKYLNLQ